MRLLSRSLRRTTLIVIAAAVLTGCAATRFAPQSLAPGQTTTNIDARTLRDPSLKQFLEQNLKRPLETWPMESWDFPTLTLAAWYFHPSLDIAQAQWRAAEAAIVKAEVPLPFSVAQPDSSTDSASEYDSGNGRGDSLWTPNIGTRVPPETKGKHGQRAVKAEHLAETARLHLAAVAWQARANVRTSLLNHVVTRRRLALLNKLSELQREIIERGRDWETRGDISWRELLAIHSRYANTLMARLDALEQVMQSREHLADALGLHVSALLYVDVNYDLSRRASEHFTLAGLHRQALHSRSDILGALADWVATDAELCLQSAKQSPTVRFNQSYQWDAGENKWTVGLNCDLPVLKRKKAPIAEAEARYAEAAARLLKVQAKVIAEIDRSVVAYHAALLRLDDLHDLLATQKKQREALESRVKTEAINQFELLTAQSQVLTAELLKLEAQEKVQLALGSLEDAMQQPAQ